EGEFDRWIDDYDMEKAEHHLERATMLLVRNDGPLARISVRAHSAWIRALLEVNQVEAARSQCEILKASI
ncbi:MAG: hypothetical protein P1V35_16905, partial [Planctomycetota bacterium]|nr:hypothetical protein [Planctomycetota bacterium]